MKDEFVSFEQAKALKALGFDAPCIAFYTEKKTLFLACDRDGDQYDVRNLDLHDDVTAPTWNQAFKFFRDKHIFITLGLQQLFYFEIPMQGYLSPEYKTYEEAQSAALDKLIELYGKVL